MTEGQPVVTGGPPLQILLLSHYFEPEDGAPQRRWASLIERLSERGHDVHVIAPTPHHPAGRAEPNLDPSLRPGARTRGAHGGTVHRVRFLPHSGSLATRTLDHLYVARRSVKLARRLAKRGAIAPDVVVATAPGLPTLWAGKAVAQRLSAPLIVEMRDAWPDLVSHTPGLRAGLTAQVKRLVHWGVTRLQRDAALVVTTTESFAEVLRRRGVRQVQVIRNGALLERYAGIAASRADHDELRVLYMGTIGRSQGLETVLRASAAARGDGVNIDVRIVGHGADARRLRSLNVDMNAGATILDRVAPHEVAQHYDWADTTLVSLRDWKPFEWTVPSKLYELMATGKHITAMVAGEAARLVRESGAGDVVKPGDPNDLARLWRQLARNRDRILRSSGGRDWVAKNAAYDLLAERYEAALQAARRTGSDAR